MRGSNLIKLVIFLAILAGSWWLDGVLQLSASFDPEVLRAEGAAGPGWIAGYLLFWVLAPGVLPPTLAGGVLFGWAGGTLMGVVGATLAAVVQYGLVRGLLRDPAVALLGTKVDRVKGMLKERDLAVLVAWRLLWMPVSILTVGAVLSEVSLKRFLVAIPAMIPGMLAITLAADSVFLYGLCHIPCERIGALATLLVIGTVGYVGLMRRYPELSLAR